MKKLLYVYQNYRGIYSSAALSILRGFENLPGLDVEVFEVKPISFNFNLNRILNRLPFVRNIHFKKQNKLLIKKLNQGSFDYLFVMKGTDIRASTLQIVKQNNSGIKLICFNPDDPFNLASSNDEIIKSIKLYDHYCIWTKLLDQKLVEAGANHVVYLPFGVDEDIIFPLDAKKQYDISFIGNGDEERHNLIKKLSIELSRRNLAYKVHVFGSNWYNIADNVIVYPQRIGKDLLKTIAASKINLNLLRKQNKNSINMRTFEIPAAGGFMLHEDSIEAKNFFIPNKEAVYFKTIEELVDLCDKYLKSAKCRKRFIQNCECKIGKGQFYYTNIIKLCFKEIE